MNKSIVEIARHKHENSSLKIFDIPRSDRDRLVTALKCNDSKTFFDIARNEWNLNDSQVSFLLSDILGNADAEVQNNLPADIKPYYRSYKKISEKIADALSDINPKKVVDQLPDRGKKTYYLSVKGSAEGVEVGVDGSVRIERTGDTFQVRIDGKVSAALAGQLGMTIGNKGASVSGKVGIGVEDAIEFNDLDKKTAEKIMKAIRDGSMTYTVGSLAGGPAFGASIVHATSNVPMQVGYLFDKKDLEVLKNNASVLELSGEAFAGFDVTLDLAKFGNTELKANGQMSQQIAARLEFPKDDGAVVLRIIEKSTLGFGGKINALEHGGSGEGKAEISFDHSITLPKDFDISMLLKNPQKALQELAQRDFSHISSTKVKVSGALELGNEPELKKKSFAKVNGEIAYELVYDKDVRDDMILVMQAHLEGKNKSLEELIKKFPQPTSSSTRVTKCDGYGIAVEGKYSGFGGEMNAGVKDCTTMP